MILSFLPQVALYARLSEAARRTPTPEYGWETMTTPKLLDFHGKRALITGASKGIGRGLATAFAAHGADIVALARDKAGLAAIKREVEALGRACETVRADLAEMDEVRRVAAQAEGFGVDILVNNAGVSFPESALTTSLENWEQTFAVNVRAAFFLAQAFGTPMLARGWGRIVNLSSQAGLVALPDHVAYCASKGALEDDEQSFGARVGTKGRHRQLRGPDRHRHADGRDRVSDLRGQGKDAQPHPGRALWRGA